MAGGGEVVTIPARRAARLWLAGAAFAVGALAILGGLTLDAEDVAASRYQPQFTAIVGGPASLVVAAVLVVRTLRVPWFARLSSTGLTLQTGDEIRWDAIDWFRIDRSSVVVRMKPVDGVEQGFREAPLRRCRWSADELGATLERRGAQRAPTRDGRLG